MMTLFYKDPGGNIYKMVYKPENTDVYLLLISKRWVEIISKRDFNSNMWITRKKLKEVKEDDLFLDFL